MYYWPDENTSIKKAKLEGVILKNLVTIVGDYKTPVKNIEISGIKFEHAQRTLMEVYEPLLRSDWTIYRGGAIFIENSENRLSYELTFVDGGDYSETVLYEVSDDGNNMSISYMSNALDM